ncbi:MAG: nuclear transport factor 2 family protein [Rhizobiales bacterium]|nr:nuclear transport factor 2 family protein [Rhizobacter sp.]
MNAQTNKQRMQAIYAALAEGDSRPFVAAMADDFCWVMPGSEVWSGRWQGKQAVLHHLLEPLVAQFATKYKSRALHLIAEGDTVVVECRGEVKTVRGDDYNNAYCNVIRFDAAGQMRELTEYMDTALCQRVLTVIEAPSR